MLLGRAVLDDLMVFALHVDQCDYVLQTPSGPNGFNEGDTFYTDYLNTGLEQRQAQPRPADRRTECPRAVRPGSLTRRAGIVPTVNCSTICA